MNFEPFELLPVSTLIIGTDEKIKYVNEVFLKNFKKTRDDCLNTKIHEIFLKEEAKKINEALATCKKEGYASFETTFTHSNKNILYYYVQIATKTDTVNESNYIAITLTDITNVKEREKNLENIIENTASLIFQWDQNGIITYINKAFEDFFGWSKDEIIGKNLVGTIVPEVESSGRDLKALMNNIIKNPEKYKNNLNENVCKNGKHVWISWTNQPIFNATNKTFEIISVGNDTTELKKREDELSKLADETIAVMETIGSGDYSGKISTNYELHNVKLVAETINSVVDYLRKSDEELHALLKELATPAVEVMKGIVIMPLVGKLTSDRALDAMEILLNKLAATQSKVGIVDITGVPTVDSAVADNLIKTMEGVKLIGSIPILTGISPIIAKNLVRIGVKFDFLTKATLSEGLDYAIKTLKKE